MDPSFLFLIQIRGLTRIVTELISIGLFPEALIVQFHQKLC